MNLFKVRMTRNKKENDNRRGGGEEIDGLRPGNRMKQICPELQRERI